MPTGYQIKDQDACYFLTLQIVEWVDIFTRKNYRDLIVQNLDYCQKHKGLRIFAYVIMSNHIHLLVRSENGNLSGTIRDFKSFTSKEMLKLIENENESRKDWMLKIFSTAACTHKRNSDYQIWTHENHAEHIYSEKFTSQKLEYIHNNPVRAGWVDRPEEYCFSSAKNYADMEGLLDVFVLDRSWKTI